MVYAVTRAESGLIPADATLHRKSSHCSKTTALVSLLHVEDGESGCILGRAPFTCGVHRNEK